jgi:hypothetical protein
MRRFSWNKTAILTIYIGDVGRAWEIQRLIGRIWEGNRECDVTIMGNANHGFRRYSIERFRTDNTLISSLMDKTDTGFRFPRYEIDIGYPCP